MPKASVSRLIEREKTKLINFVLDIEKYPEFIPFCIDSKVYEKREDDDVVNIEDIKIYVNPKASLFLIGTQMDYQEGELESGFKFINPNEKGRCGCGESFHV